MALTTCSECSKELSEKAFVCPHCGATRGMAFLRGQTSEPRFWVLLVIGFLLVEISGGAQGLHDRLDALEGKVKDWYASVSSDSQD